MKDRALVVPSHYLKSRDRYDLFRELAVLKRMFTLAYHSKPGRVREVSAFPRLKEAAPRDEQYKALQSHPEELWLKAILAVGYSFGFRKSEVLNLKVRQIDTSADSKCQTKHTLTD